MAKTRSHWITDCDANMDPTECAGGDRLQESRAKAETPPGGSATYCDKEIRKTLDYFVVSATT